MLAFYFQIHYPFFLYLASGTLGKKEIVLHFPTLDNLYFFTMIFVKSEFSEILHNAQKFGEICKI